MKAPITSRDVFQFLRLCLVVIATMFATQYGFGRQVIYDDLNIVIPITLAAYSFGRYDGRKSGNSSSSDDCD